MTIKPEKPLNQKYALALVLFSACCALTMLFTNKYWLGLGFCVLNAGLFFIIGMPGLLLQFLSLAGFAFLDWYIGKKTFSCAFLTLGAGVICVKAFMNAAGKNVDQLETRLSKERQRRDNATLVSSLGQARNLRAYQNDAAIYLKLTQRYELNLCIMLWNLENTDLLRKCMSEDAFSELASGISSTISHGIRAEDMVYLLHENGSDLCWGSLHISNDPDVHGVIEARIRKLIAEYPLDDGLSLDFKVSYAVADRSMSPMSLLDSARAQV